MVRLGNDLGHDVLLDHYARNDHRRITSRADADPDFITARRRS
jgi:hypothetical protein